MDESILKTFFLKLQMEILVWSKVDYLIVNKGGNSVSCLKDVYVWGNMTWVLDKDWALAAGYHSFE